MFTQLSPTQHQLAHDYLSAHARPLEKALYQVRMQGTSPDLVIDALAPYQNADGGFGNALEPDIRLSDSSVIATTVALQHLREINASADLPIVQNACQYLVNTYDEVQQAWHIIPANVDDAPHAPWWTYDADITKNYANPRAEILGYLYEFSENFPDDMHEKLTQAVTNYLLVHDDEMEMHDIQCYVRLLETETLPEANRQAMLPKMRAILEHNVDTDPAKWSAYGLPPLAVVSSPESPFYDLFADAIPANIRFVIDTQTDEGYWQPAWSWDFVDEGAWAQAEKAWHGVLTVNNLRTLAHFNALPD
ncbi:MAG: hypothetical protein AAFN11_06455 [Chloroflexota bacterium]